MASETNGQRGKSTWYLFVTYAKQYLVDGKLIGKDVGETGILSSYGLRSLDELVALSS